MDVAVARNSSAGKTLSSTLVSWRHRMSGCCSTISRSTSAARARTELMFQEAILSRWSRVCA